MVPHVEGSPDLPNLMRDVDRLLFARSSERKIPNHGIAIFMPTDTIPTPIVIQVLSDLQKTRTFDRIVLSGGIK